jgi:hypothetical protein
MDKYNPITRVKERDKEEIEGKRKKWKAGGIYKLPKWWLIMTVLTPFFLIQSNL